MTEHPAHTEAGEGLTEAERLALARAIDAVYPMSPASRLTAAVEQIIRDRQADALEAAAEAWPGLRQEGNVYVWLRERARTLRGAR